MQNKNLKNQFDDLDYFGHYTLKEKSKNIKYEIKIRQGFKALPLMLFNNYCININ